MTATITVATSYTTSGDTILTGRSGSRLDRVCNQV